MWESTLKTDQNISRPSETSDSSSFCVDVCDSKIGEHPVDSTPPRQENPSIPSG